jgi:hypothetical protein
MTWDAYHGKIAEAMDVEVPPLVHVPSELLWRAVPEHAGAARWNFMHNNIFDNAAARADLGFRYTVPFADGARRTVAWLRENDRIESWRSQPYYDRLIAAWERLGTQLVSAMSNEAGTAAARARPKPGVKRRKRTATEPKRRRARRPAG